MSVCLVRRRESSKQPTAQDRDGFLVVAGDYFIYILGRETPLAPVAPGTAGHAPDRGLFTGVVEPLLARATTGDQVALQQLRGHFALECSYGKRSTGWVVELSTFPWLERQPLALARSGKMRFDETNSCFSDEGGCWRVFDSTFAEEELKRLFD
jgi:hypothetical protein